MHLGSVPSHSSPGAVYTGKGQGLGHGCGRGFLDGLSSLCPPRASQQERTSSRLPVSLSKAFFDPPPRACGCSWCPSCGGRSLDTVDSLAPSSFWLTLSQSRSPW